MDHEAHQKTVRIQTRTLKPHHELDVKEALQIFCQAYLDPWPEQPLRNLLDARNTGALLAAADPRDVDDLGTASKVQPMACACLIYHCYPTGRRIVTVGVLRDALRLGYATALIRALQKKVQASRRLDEILAWIPQDNAPALVCFQKCGFQQVQTRPGYFGSGRDACIMQWNRTGEVMRPDPRSHPN